MTLALSVFQPTAGKTILLRFREPEKKRTFEISVGISSTVFYDDLGQPTDSTEAPATLPGWVLIVNTIAFDLLVLEPSVYSVFYASKEKEQYLGAVIFASAAAAPILPDERKALISDPLARKAVRFLMKCNKCFSELKVFAALVGGHALEEEGWISNDMLPDKFSCKCGAEEISLIPLRDGLHGMLRPSMAPHPDPSTQILNLYQRSTLESNARALHRLASSDVSEEMLQQFLEQNPIFFSMFAPIKIMVKKPILAEYITDFAVLTSKKELVLVEIETASKSLLKRDGGISAPLQHALDQVRNWQRVFDDERSAALRAFGLESKDVAKIKGLVIAGRTPESETHVKMLRFSSWTDIDLLTYDDLVSYVAGLAERISSS
ncbi:MAG: Shedu immune nuclease family protein [Terriglobales bacterium]